ncbi:hypothetical protein IC007_0582 [Sulfuracidifex tepidarius]|uniref:Uncharacterized protein n=1 Tax=Sulfuracidifex tepidarius TaxID=1294262 RepID=A0A510E0W4_9CREN|nr:hypothetical protein IC007_0582 [Sulfuracidifex tepidarius]
MSLVVQAKQKAWSLKSRKTNLNMREVRRVRLD